MKATPIPINWHSGLPIFARESFLKGVSNEYGWLGGVDESGSLRCILPYTIVRKAGIRMIRFRVETISLQNGISPHEEKMFLNSVIDYFKSTGADIIIPATTNAIFRTYPDGADIAPYGTYAIDLSVDEEVLWRNIERITRQNINTAAKKGVTIHKGFEDLGAAHKLIVETFQRSNLPFMDYEAFERYVGGLGENGLLMIADYEGVAQSYVIFAFSDYCAYAVYAGNSANQAKGANKLLYWEAIRFFKSLGVKKYDFVGARINPEKGSKEDSINALKRHFGAKLTQGYMWKFPIRPLRSLVYTYAVRYLRGGDIVDLERHKLMAPGGSEPDETADKATS